MLLQEFIQNANQLGAARTPFLFCIDYEMEQPFVIPLAEIDASNLQYQVANHTNIKAYSNVSPTYTPLRYTPTPKYVYARGYKIVQEALQSGNTYLLNLTYPHQIHHNINQLEVLNASESKYKLWLKDRIVCYSPECFIKIQEQTIYSYPMKGTIDATITNATEKILADKKELYEHNTIVDLIRNDLAIVAKNITVERFRYTEEIQTPNGALIQVSSEIKGHLCENWQETIGNILIKLLPAGSISGAPKEKTCAVIQRAEGQKRGYYTGIFGIFDGKNLDSAVAIRMLQKHDNEWYYHAGGGITAMSDVSEEYNEMNAKIYVPTFRKY